jgi:uncharacterized protein YbjT (DUF2867 family)
VSGVESRVLVTGGTGTLGRVLVPQLRAAGHQVAVLSRRPGTAPEGVERRVGDLRSSTGLGAALTGIDTVVHLASDPLRASKVDVEGSDRLVAEAAAAGVGHLVYLSIVGCDRNPYPYYRAKTAVESLVLDGRVPGTVLRATQFHDFVPRVAGMLRKGPLLVLPRGLRGQLVDLRDVSDRLVGLVAAGPTGRARDLGGPQVLGLRDAILRWTAATGRREPRVLELPVVGATLRAFAAGTNLPDPGADLGDRTFDAWLAEQQPGQPIR